MLSCETTRMQRGQDSPVDPPAATTGLGVDVVSPRRPGHIPRGLAGGILTAIGGFLDIGDLVTNAVVGSHLGLSLDWAVVVGVVGICVFAQMSGRVAAVSGGRHSSTGSSQGWPALLGGPAGIGYHRRVDRTGLGGRKAGPGVVGRAEGLGITR